MPRVRDRLNESLGGNVLCIESLAAGLMNNFPCIVIRGICDYADSHDHNDWQEHAAAVAAGYAKELLEITDPMDITDTPEARTVIAGRKLRPFYLINALVRPDRGSQGWSGSGEVPQMHELSAQSDRGCIFGNI